LISTRTALGFILGAIMLMGCGGRHQHKVVNVGDGLLHEVTVTCGERSFNHGYLAANAHASYSGSFRIRANEVIKISWSTDGETFVTKELRLKHNPGVHEVIFRLDGKDVTVNF